MSGRKWQVNCPDERRINHYNQNAIWSRSRMQLLFILLSEVTPVFIRPLHGRQKLASKNVFLLYVLLLTSSLAGQAQTAATGRQAAVDNEYQTAAVLWTQSSAEYRALAYQTFSLAKLRLDQALADRKSRRLTKPPAVIVDADETVLDNSRFQAELILRGVAYSSDAWQAWCNRAEAGAVPGAVDFLNYASSRRVNVFYITNRREAEKPGTINNLKRLGFPKVNEETVMIREQGATASKESRRQKVASHHRVILLIGDNLNDFNDNFAGKSIADRKAQVDAERSEFGNRNIVVPNPMYGDWESAVYGYKSNLSEADKHASRRSVLRGY
jgi:5'-nucleotidase (lipoprotein e(P4) family)